LNLEGQQFGRLTVISRGEKNKWGNYSWNCLCECGNEITTRGTYLKDGSSTSCGCRRTEVNAQAKSHGHTTASGKSPAYESYTSARQRCTNPNVTRWDNYGGAGVEFCFDSFEDFYEYMGDRPEGTTLGRYGDVGNYERGNIAWQTAAQQGAEAALKRAAA
jgi:hypothetical protein